MAFATSSTAKAPPERSAEPSCLPVGLTRGNIDKTPRVKLSATEANTIEDSPILEGEQATLFRSGTCTMQHAFDIVPHECCTARACVAGVRLFNVLSAAIWFRVGGRKPLGEQECSSFMSCRALARGRFGVVAGARDEPF